MKILRTYSRRRLVIGFLGKGDKLIIFGNGQHGGVH